VDPWASDATVGGIGRRVEEFLEPRRLLTTKVHVVGPRYIDVSIRSRGRISHAHPREALRRGIEGRLRRFLDPLNGGAEGTGWPFGRAISTAEVYRQLHGIDGIEEITTVEFEVPDPSRLRRNAFGDAEVLLRPEELPRVGQVRFVS
jgi:hypothetical protein